MRFTTPLAKLHVPIFFAKRESQLICPVKHSKNIISSISTHRLFSVQRAESNFFNSFKKYHKSFLI